MFCRFSGHIAAVLAHSAVLLALFSTCIVTSGCSVLTAEEDAPKQKSYALMNFNNGQKSKAQNQPASKNDSGLMPSLAETIKKPLSPEQTEELLDEVGSNWLYGQGIGETALTVGAIAAFPPYAILVLGNAALQISGEEPVGLSTVLPDEAAETWTSAYDGVTSVPGQGIAYVSDEDFRDKETARERILSVINKSK